MILTFIHNIKHSVLSHFATKNATSLKSSSAPAIADNCDGRRIKGWKVRAILFTVASINLKRSGDSLN